MHYKIFIYAEINKQKEFIVKPGEQYLNEEGNPITGNVIDEETGEIYEQPFVNDTGADFITVINKTEEELKAEKQIIIDKKTAEIQDKIDAYESKKQYQRQHGGPAPVAEFEIKKICNEYDCKFEVIIKD